MSIPTIDSTKSFTADVYILDGSAKHPVRINDGGWLAVLQDNVLPTTLWFGCYQEDGEDFFIIKEYTKGASNFDTAINISSNDFLGLYKNSSRPWKVKKADGSAVARQIGADIDVSICTKGGRHWKVSENFLKVRNGEGSQIQIHVHKWGISRF